MSRTRVRTHQEEPEVRGSPLPSSDESDGGSDRDQDEADGVERSPPRAAGTEEYEAERYYLRSINRNREASRSPELSRRSIKQHASVTKEFRGHRGSIKTYPEDYESKLRTDRQLQPESAYGRQPYEQEKDLPKSLVQVEDTICSKKFLIFIVVVIPVFYFMWRYFFVSNPGESSHTSRDDMVVAVKNALSRFENIPGDVAFQLSAGISNIVESDPNKPSIFVLLHNNTGVGPFCLANSIGNVAMKYLESNEEGPLILKPDELLENEKISEDYGWVIEDYKPRIEKHRSVIIDDLQKFPGKVAMAFHFLCDVYSPVVPKSLFVFIFHVPDVYSKKEVEQAEKAMHRIWRNDVKDDQRQALITRLTEDVISLPQNILHNEACP